MTLVVCLRVVCYGPVIQSRGILVLVLELVLNLPFIEGNIPLFCVLCNSSRASAASLKRPSVLVMRSPC